MTVILRSNGLPLLTAGRGVALLVRAADVVPVPALKPPKIQEASISPAAGHVSDVFSAQATVTGNPVPTLSYQWNLNGAPIGSATAATYTAGTQGALSVSVTAINSEGAVTLDAPAVMVTIRQMTSVFEAGVFEDGVFA